MLYLQYLQGIRLILRGIKLFFKSNLCYNVACISLLTGEYYKRMIKIAICDDEKSYQEIIGYKIEQCLQSRFEMECEICRFNKLDDLKEHIENNIIDVVFLDIMVNDENAMDWSIKNLQNKYTQIVFMTAFPQCAYNISEANCCYYLVKSRLTEETLTKALQRALQKTTKKDPNLTIVKSGNRNYTVNYQDVVYIETFDNNITLHLINRDNITIYSSLKEYAQKLPPNFMRCHKCYMVNMNHITGYEPHKFILSLGYTVSIPPKKYKSVVKTYENYLLNL